MTKTILTIIATAITLAVHAQTGADYLKAFHPSDCIIPFDINAEGQPFRVFWGMDTAWNSEGNVRRGINHIGVENFSTGRLSYQPTYKLITKSDGSYDLRAETDTAKSYYELEAYGSDRS